MLYPNRLLAIALMRKRFRLPRRQADPSGGESSLAPSTQSQG